MKKYIVLLVLVCNSQVFAQTKIFLFRDAKKEGISIAHLDSTYKSAVNSNTELAVFKTPEEQQNLRKAYSSFIQSMASFLTKNNFAWDSPARSYNRVYMNADGTVEYFVFQFRELLSPGKETEFLRLVSLYTKENKFPITAHERFAQCSAVQYGK